MSEQVADISYTVESPLYWFMYILAAAILVGVLVVYRRNIRLEADVVGRKLAKAGRVASKRLKDSKTFMDSHRNDEFYASIAKALWGYISDKLSISPSGLTRDNVADKLNAYGLSGEDADKVLESSIGARWQGSHPIHQMRRWPIYMQKPPKQSKALKT